MKIKIKKTIYVTKEIFEQYIIPMVIFGFLLIISTHLKKNGFVSILPKWCYYQIIPESITNLNFIQNFESTLVLKDLTPKQHLNLVILEYMPASEEHPYKSFFLNLIENEELYRKKVKALSNGVTYIILDQDVQEYFIGRLATTPLRVVSYLDDVKSIARLFEKERNIKIRAVDSEQQFESCIRAFKNYALDNVDRHNMNRQFMLNYNKTLTGAEIGAIAVIGTVAILGAVTIGVTVYNKYW